MPRWQFAFALLRNEITGTRIDLPKLIQTAGTRSLPEMVDAIASLLLGAPLPESERDALIANLKKQSSVPVIANLNATTAGGWGITGNAGTDADLNSIGSWLEKQYPKDVSSMTYAVDRPTFNGDFLGRPVRAFVAGLDDAGWQREVSYTTTSGKPARYALYQMFLQVINHGTHHRSQAASILKGFDHSPGELDFTVFLNERQ